MSYRLQGCAQLEFDATFSHRCNDKATKRRGEDKIAFEKVKVNISILTSAQSAAEALCHSSEAGISHAASQPPD